MLLMQNTSAVAIGAVVVVAKVVSILETMGLVLPLAAVLRSKPLHDPGSQEQQQYSLVVGADGRPNRVQMRLKRIELEIPKGDGDLISLVQSLPLVVPRRVPQRARCYCKLGPLSMPQLQRLIYFAATSSTHTTAHSTPILSH